MDVDKATLEELVKISAHLFGKNRSVQVPAQILDCYNTSLKNFQ